MDGVRSISVHCSRIVRMIGIVALCCLTSPVFAQVDVRASIYANGDLILINPQQSTAIFISVIVCSTGLEFLFEILESQTNRYIRVIYKSVKEECTVLGLSELVLLFIAFSFTGLSQTWRIVIQWVAMCLLYMACAYTIFVSVVMIFLKLNAKAWFTFEWARLDADVYHTSNEQLFKLARRYFTSRLVDVIRERFKKNVAEIPAVAFSSYITHVEKQYLRMMLDFSMKTYGGLAFVIVLNGSRSITVATIAQANIGQIISFMAVVGYGIVLAQFIVKLILERRLRQFLLLQTNSETAKRDLGAESCLFFTSASATFEVFKIFFLSMMWYTAVFIMCYLYTSWAAVGYYCILMYIFAIIPPILFCLQLPWCFTLVVWCAGLVGNLDSRGIDLLLKGVSALNDDEESEDEKATAEAKQRAKQGDNDNDEQALDDDFEDPRQKRNRPHPTEHGESTHELESHRFRETTTGGGSNGVVVGQETKHTNFFGEVEDTDWTADEYNGPRLTLHDSVPEELAPRGEPERILGVLPVHIKKEWQVKALRPVF